MFITNLPIFLAERPKFHCLNFEIIIIKNTWAKNALTALHLIIDIIVGMGV